MSMCSVARHMLVMVLSGLTGTMLSQQPFDLDTSFGTSVEEIYISSVLSDASGGIIVSGSLRFPGGATLKRTARLDATGNFDPTYDASGLGGGKLTAWENELTYVGTDQTVRRLRPDGFQDHTFIEMNLGPYFGSVQGGDYHVFPDGRVLMSGAHVLSDTQRGFDGLYSLIWFSNEGYLDTTRIHRYCDEVIFAIEAQPDGKFLCSGTMNSFEDQPVKRVFRVHPDGALDNSFDADIQQWGEARDYFTLSDGRIWVGGSLRLNSSEEIKSLLRFLPNGTIDPTFHAPQFAIEFDPFATIPVLFDILQISPERFVVTGRFDRVDGQERGGLAMLDADGNLVNDAFIGEGCGLYNYNGSLYKSISGITPAPDGSYYIHGAYHGYDDGTTNDTTQRMVSRLYGLDVGVYERNIIRAPYLKLYPNPSTNWTTAEIDLRAAPKNAVLVVQDITGRVLQRLVVGNRNTQLVLDSRNLAPGSYRVDLRNDGTVLHSETLIVRQ